MIFSRTNQRPLQTRRRRRPFFPKSRTDFLESVTGTFEFWYAFIQVFPVISLFVFFALVLWPLMLYITGNWDKFQEWGYIISLVIMILFLMFFAILLFDVYDEKQTKRRQEMEQHERGTQTHSDSATKLPYNSDFELGSELNKVHEITDRIEDQVMDNIRQRITDYDLKHKARLDLAEELDNALPPKQAASVVMGIFDKYKDAIVEYLNLYPGVRTPALVIKASDEEKKMAFFLERRKWERIITELDKTKKHKLVRNISRYF